MWSMYANGTKKPTLLSGWPPCAGLGSHMWCSVDLSLLRASQRVNSGSRQRGSRCSWSATIREYEMYAVVGAGALLALPPYAASVERALLPPLCFCCDAFVGGDE